MTCTYTAADTFSGVDTCYSAVNGYSILWADLYAITVAKTRPATALIAVECQIYSRTALGTLIIVLFLGSAASSVAGNVSYLFYNVFGSDTENICNGERYVISAGDAKVGYLCSSLAESLSVAVASAVSASTAVGAGQTVTDLSDLFIFLNSKEYA